MQSRCKNYAILMHAVCGDFAQLEKYYIKFDMSLKESTFFFLNCRLWFHKYNSPFKITFIRVVFCFVLFFCLFVCLFFLLFFVCLFVCLFSLLLLLF